MMMMMGVVMYILLVPRMVILLYFRWVPRRMIAQRPLLLPVPAR